MSSVFSVLPSTSSPKVHEETVSIPATVDKQLEDHNVEALMTVIHKGTSTDRKTAFATLHTLLEEDREGLVDELLTLNSLPIFIEYLEHSEDHYLQLSALMVFAHITSGSKRQSQAVVTSGAVLPFIDLVDSQVLQIAEQALICVGNIACEDSFTRKVLYENGGLHAVIRFIQRDDLSPDQLNSGAWAFSNLSRSRCLIAIDALEFCTDAILSLLQSDDPEILRSTCAASAYLTDGPTNRVQLFIDKGICPFIVNLIKHSDPLVVFSSLRAVSNLLSGTDEQSESLIDLDIVSSLSYVVKRHKERRIVKEACMALSNIAAGSQSDIKRIVEANIIEHLIHIARFAPVDVRIEATWTLGNAVSGAGHGLIKEFLTSDCMKVLSSTLASKNPSIVKLSLQAIKNFLWCGDFAECPDFDLAEWDSENDEEFWQHAQWLSDCKGFFRLASLRRSPDLEIAQAALTLLEALIENPYAEYADDDSSHQSSDAEQADSEYEDHLLGTFNSPTAIEAARNAQV